MYKETNLLIPKCGTWISHLLFQKNNLRRHTESLWREIPKFLHLVITPSIFILVRINYTLCIYIMCYFYYPFTLSSLHILMVFLSDVERTFSSCFHFIFGRSVFFFLSLFVHDTDHRIARVILWNCLSKLCSKGPNFAWCNLRDHVRNWTRFINFFLWLRPWHGNRRRN